MFQILAEFIRVTNVDIGRVFYSEIDSIRQQLIHILSQRGGKYGAILKANYTAMQTEFPVCTKKYLPKYCRINWAVCYAFSQLQACL